EPNPATERYVADLRQQAMDQAEAAVRAYLSAAVPADVAGLVEELQTFKAAFAAEGDNFGMEVSEAFHNAATALVSMSAELENERAENERLRAKLREGAVPDGWICEDEFTFEQEQFDAWVFEGLSPQPFILSARSPAAPEG